MAGVLFAKDEKVYGEVLTYGLEQADVWHKRVGGETCGNFRKADFGQRDCFPWL